MTTPSNPTIMDVQAAVRRFRDARNWRQFHSPKNLSMSIAIEAAELMEHFQWLTLEEASRIAHEDSAARIEIGEELADVFIYCLSLADILEYDLAELILDKLGKNELRYPVPPT